MRKLHYMRYVGFMAMAMIVAVGHVAGQAPAADPDARIKALEKQVATLQKQLDDANVRCAQLAQQAAAKGGAVGVGPAVAKAPDLLKTEIIQLTEPQWLADGTAEPQQLAVGLDNVVGFKLTPADDKLTVSATDPAHATLMGIKANKALGTGTPQPAGKLSLEKGTLLLQWFSKDTARTAMDALKYASLELQSAGATTVKKLRFVAPVELALSLDQATTIRLDIPAWVAPKGALTMPNPPLGCTPTNAADGTLMLKEGEVALQVRYDQTMPGVSVTGGNIDAADVKHRFDTVDAEYQTEKQQVAAMKTHNVALNETAAVRAANAQTLKEAESHLADVTKTRSNLQQELNTTQAKAAILAKFQGSVVSVMLPNGVQVAEITLGAGK